MMIKGVRGRIYSGEEGIKLIKITKNKFGAKLGLYKLREWVGTVTGKGDRWGRDSVGRSAPAFMAASTTALPPLT